MLRSRGARAPPARPCSAANPPPSAPPLAEGVVEQDGEVVLARTARAERDPVLTLRAAAAAAQAGLPISLHAVRRLAAAAKPLPVPWPAEARDELVTLLGAGESTVPVWEALEAEGLITQLLPDWERVRCRPQRNPVHTWTVDRHLVETAVQASSLTRRVGRPDLLLVCALLHDIGKGWPGDHSVAGEVIARDVAARIGFDRDDMDVIATVVRHHLLLIDTATRRDLDDPATVRRGGRPGRLRSPTLELLHALTEADALATGPAAWSSWRASLVTDLVSRVAAVLAGDDLAEPDRAAPSAEQERLAVEALRTGGPVLALHTQTEPPREGAEPGTRRRRTAHRAARPARACCRPPPVCSRCTGSPSGRPTCAPSNSPPSSATRLDVLLLSWRVAAEYGSLPQATRLRADLVTGPGRLAGHPVPARRARSRVPAAPGRQGPASPGDRGLRPPRSTRR